MHTNGKPKKSKNESLRSAVSAYMKEHGYMPMDKQRRLESNPTPVMNKMQYAVHLAMQMDSQITNSFTYSNVQCHSYNQVIIDQQFGRFIQFVESQEDEARAELKRLYAPMVCHLFLEMLKSRELKVARELLRKYAHLIAPVDMYDAPLPTKVNGCSVSSNGNTLDASTQGNIRFTREAQNTNDPELIYFMKLVQILCSCTKAEVAEQHPVVAHFRSSKFEYHITQEIAETLRQFLEKRGHVLIMNLLHTWVHVHVINIDVFPFGDDNMFFDNGEGSELSDSDEPSRTFNEVESPPNQTPVAPLSDPAVSELFAYAEGIVEAQPARPYFMAIADKGRGLTAADLDAHECHLAVGFNSTVVQILPLDQQRCSGKSYYQPYTSTLCKWHLSNTSNKKVNGDIVEDDYESEDEAGNVHPASSLHPSAQPNNTRSYPDNLSNECGGVDLRGHAKGVTDLRFSMHYPLLFSASKDGTVRAWHSHNYNCAGIYEGNYEPIWCMSESPSGMFFASGSRDFTARLFCIEREHPLIHFVGHTKDVESIAFHPNGAYIATGSADHSVRLWSVTSGKCLRMFPDCRRPVTALAFSPNGRHLAVGGEESKVRIYDLSGSAQLCELSDYTARVTNLAWDAKSQHLSTVCSDGSFRCWNIQQAGNTHASTGATALPTDASSTLPTAKCLFSVNSSCNSLVRTLYGRSGKIYCIGTNT